MPAVTHILESALYVADLDRAETFYRNLFGWPCFIRDARMAALGVPGQCVLLLFRIGAAAEASPTPFGLIPPHDGRGTQHMAFAIAADSLPEWEARLAAAGVPIESRLAWDSGSVALYFRDPDGHSIELATPRLWPNYGRE
jgi:catechol 2,3-dioxygenase-like lactoylglutathione lyase family enzyme